MSRWSSREAAAGLPDLRGGELARGKGVRLQRCRSGGLVDAHVFKLADGLPWQDGSPEGRLANVSVLEKWLGHRAEVGLMMARSFPKFERFGR